MLFYITLYYISYHWHLLIKSTTIFYNKFNIKLFILQDYYF